MSGWEGLCCSGSMAPHGLVEPVVSGRGARGLRTRKASSWGALPAPGVGAPVRAASGKPARLGAWRVATQCIAVHVPWAMRMPCMCRFEPAGLRAVAVANIS